MGVNYSRNIAQICKNCTADQKASLLDGLKAAFVGLASALPEAVIICNPVDFETCNTFFFEFFGTSVDHGRGVPEDLNILSTRYSQRGHLVQVSFAASVCSNIL